MNFKNIEELSGDASHRKFYRDKKNNSIIVYAKKEKRKNLLIYAAINDLLKKNKILTPRLISEKYKNNYIVIEDQQLSMQNLILYLKQELLNLFLF